MRTAIASARSLPPYSYYVVLTAKCPLQPDCPSIRASVHQQYRQRQPCAPLCSTAVIAVGLDEHTAHSTLPLTSRIRQHFILMCPNGAPMYLKCRPGGCLVSLPTAISKARRYIHSRYSTWSHCRRSLLG